MPLPFDPALLPRIANAERRASGMARWREAAAEAEPELSAWMLAQADDPAAAALLEAVVAGSPFLAHCLVREPALVRRIEAEGPDAVYESLITELVDILSQERDQAAVMKGLRVAKRRAALLIALADITGQWPLERITGALSRLAETSLSVCVRHLLRQAHEAGDIALTHPDDPERSSGLIVIGMGKLGARELNYSSDIDIIILYDEELLRYTGRRSIQERLVRLTRDLVKMMEERTADGYVFRTDLRLRPDPGSTPLAISVMAAETYYEGFGQNWERAAMIKARPVAGDLDAGKRFISFLRPFIWRKSLDFAAIQDIHSIKRQINAHRGGRTIAVAGHNIKIGRGGIREIEFFAQTQQLIWGGREPAVRQSPTCAALDALAQGGHIDQAVAEELKSAYAFLRQIEHRLQMVDDQQTQTLPREPEPLAELAAFAGFDDLAAFELALRERMQTVEKHYARLFEDAPPLSAAGNLVFTGGENDPETLRTLGDMGFRNPDAVASQIRGWHHGRIRATRSTRAREMLTEITPTLLRALGATADPDAAFLKFDEFVTRLPAGVPLFSLLYANPALLDMVAEIMGNAPRLAEHLSRHPALLDNVLTADFLDPPPPAAALGQDLERMLDQARDFQEVLDLTRRWTNDRKFQIGVQTMRGLIDPESAAAALSNIADAVLSRLLPAVEAEFARAHGLVPGGGVVVVAMGKLGSREMTPLSDLDLILIYHAPPEAEGSDGARPLAPSTYFARLTQRLVNAVTVKTGEGTLYEVDMRLRPSGNAGPIASSLEAFEQYHAGMAWTWEHMALSRARVVAGSEELSERVAAAIRHALTRPRDPDRLVVDVADMRERMARERKVDGPWEIKHRRGGLVDVEFLAQYLLLREAHDHPELLHPSTMETLRRLARIGALDATDANTLQEALRLWWTVQSLLRQTVEGAFKEEHAPDGLARLLAQATGEPDLTALKLTMDSRAAAVMDVFTRLIDLPAAAARARLPQPTEESSR